MADMTFVERIAALEAENERLRDEYATVLAERDAFESIATIAGRSQGEAVALLKRWNASVGTWEEMDAISKDTVAFLCTAYDATKGVPGAND